MFKRGYAFGNWSKFVRPGFQRIGATEKPAGGVLVEAYRDSTHLAVIAVNTNASPVTQKFVIDGSTVDSLTPWVTSPSPDDSLAAKTPIAVTDDSFTFDLPASSVVTFVNWDATTETPGQTNTGGPDGGTPKLNGLDCAAPVVPEQRRERRRHGLHRLERLDRQMGRSEGPLRHDLSVRRPQGVDDGGQRGRDEAAREGRRHRG